MTQSEPKQNQQPALTPNASTFTLAVAGLRLTTAPILFLTIFSTVLLLYWLTLAPGVVGGDAGEHQFAVPLLGIPHTTGYPLYILLGKLWTLLFPFGSLAWRMNLFSALAGALAAATTSLIVYRLAKPTHLPHPLTLSPSHSPILPLSHPPTLSPSHPPSLPPSLSPPSPWPGAVIAGLTLAWGLTLWQWSTIAGVRSLNIFFFALLTLEAVLWQQQRQAENASGPVGAATPFTQCLASERTLRWLALTAGLSLAHHRTTLFYLPSLIAWIGWHDRQLIRQPKKVFMLICLALAPLLLYLFIYVRGVTGPPYTHEPITDLQSFWFLVGSGDSTGLFFSIEPEFLPMRLAFIWADLLRQLSLPGVMLAALGGLLLLWRQPKHFLMQAWLVLLLLLFTLDFEVVNLNEAPTWYLMPAYFIFAIWLGLGLNGILDFGLRILDWRLSHPLTPPLSQPFTPPTLPLSHPPIQLLATLILTATLAYTLAWPNWQTLSTASVEPLDEWRQLLRGAQAQRFVESSLPYVEANSIIWGDWEQYTPFKYYQLIEGMRLDVTVRNPLNRWPEKVAAAHAAGQPIYLMRKPTDLIGTPYLSMVGPLIHVGTAPQQDVPPEINRLDANFEQELELIGYRAEIRPQLTPGGAQAGPILQLMLYWRTFHQVTWDYALSLRLLDATGQEIYKRDATHPVLSSYPTSLWTPGEVVGDFYELPLPPDRGPLLLHILPYRTEGPGQWHNLSLSDTELPQEGIKVGPFE